jgi:hypothetical protein
MGFKRMRKVTTRDLEGGEASRRCEEQIKGFERDSGSDSNRGIGRSLRDRQTMPITQL